MRVFCGRVRAAGAARSAGQLVECSRPTFGVLGPHLGKHLRQQLAWRLPQSAHHRARARSAPIVGKFVEEITECLEHDGGVIIAEIRTKDFGHLLVTSMNWACFPGSRNSDSIAALAGGRAAAAAQSGLWVQGVSDSSKAIARA